MPGRSTSRVRLAAACAVLSLGAVACSSLLGDFSVGERGPRDAAADAAGDAASGGAADSGSDGLPASDAAEAAAGDGGGDAGALAVSSSGLTVYVGQTAVLTASAAATDGAAATFAWSVVSAPAGSAVTTASLAGADVGATSFTPDTAGDFVLDVAAQAGGDTGNARVTVHAVSPKVFYMRGDLLDGGSEASFTSAYYVSTAQGDGLHAVTCPLVEPTTSQGFLSPVPQVTQFWAPDDMTDFWEAPAGQPSRFAAVVFGAGPSGAQVLFLGLEDAGCATPPAAVFYDGGAEQPQFNADGTRVAFIGGDLNIVTVNPDGTDLRVVTNYATGLADSGLAYDPNPAGFTYPPRPQWMGTSIAWARQTSASSDPPAWEIVTAEDVAGATPQRYMACPGGTPRELRFLSDGSVVVAYRTTVGTTVSASGPENLYRLAPDASKNCRVLVQYTDLGNSGLSQATDFAVSPDESRIAFVEVDGVADDAGYESNSLPGGYPTVVPVDGGAPTRLSPEYFAFGPRWIAAGSRLVGTRYDGYTDGGLVTVATSIVVRSAHAGPSPPPLVQADGYRAFASAGSNGGCDVAPGEGSRGAAAALGALAAVAFSVRRKKR